jgi:hypothetical protein
MLHIEAEVAKLASILPMMRVASFFARALGRVSQDEYIESERMLT